MKNFVAVNMSEIIETKKGLETYVSEIALLKNYLKDELETAFVLLSASGRNVEQLKKIYKDKPSALDAYEKIRDKIYALENELAAHIYVLNKN